MAWELTREELLEFYADGERNFAGVELTSIGSKESDYWGGIDLEGVDLSGINLQGAYFHKVCLIGANLTGADLGGILMIECMMSKAILKCTSFRGASLRECDLSETNLRQADFIYATIVNTSFFGAVIGSYFESSILFKVSFRGARFVHHVRNGNNPFREGDRTVLGDVTLPDGTNIGRGYV